MTVLLCFNVVLRGVVLPLFWHKENGFGFLIWLNLFGLSLLSFAPLLCHPRTVVSAKGRKDCWKGQEKRLMIWQPCCPDQLSLVGVYTRRLCSRVHRGRNWCLLRSYWSPAQTQYVAMWVSGRLLQKRLCLSWADLFCIFQEAITSWDALPCWTYFDLHEQEQFVEVLAALAAFADAEQLPGCQSP